MATLRLLVLPALAVVALAGPGCSRQNPMAPASVGATADHVVVPSLDLARPDLGVVAGRFTNGPGVVDLSLYRLTRVEGTLRGRRILTGQPPDPWVEVKFSTERQVVGVQTPVGGGPTYRQERVRHVEGTGPLTTFELWRQDRSGLYLYQSDLARTPPRVPLALARSGMTTAQAAAFGRAYDAVSAKRAALLGGPPGGPLDVEIAFLRYPLHKGATWEGRAGFNVWTVEEIAPLVTPGGRFRAARMRIELPAFFGPNDHALTWWDSPGEIKRDFHLFGSAVDEQGNVIGEVETIETFELVTYAQNVPI